MKRFGVMLDSSRNAVMKPEQVKKFIKTLAGFGYNMLQLYPEDTYEVENEPYFWYMRGLIQRRIKGYSGVFRGFGRGGHSPRASFGAPETDFPLAGIFRA